MSNEIGVYLGRFQPLHKLHEHLIAQMINDFGYEHSVLIIGSAHTQNAKNIFPLETRIKMIKNVFPELKNIYFLDDYYDDNIWLGKFVSILENFNKSICFSDVTVYCGSYDDISFFKKNPNTSKFKIKLVDRTTFPVSATKVRNAINTKNIEYIRENINPKNFDIVAGYVK